jgi:hypothetical protein
MFKRVALALSLVLLLPILSGCFEIGERVSIEPDGTAGLDFKMRLVVPEDQRKKKNPMEEAKGELSNVGSGVDGVTIEKFEVKDEYGQMILDMDLKADSFKALRNSYATFPKPDKSGKKAEGGEVIEKLFSKKGFYTMKKKGKKIVIERKIGIKRRKRKPKGKDKDKDIEALLSMLGGIMLHFDLVVPSKVISSNAQDVYGNTLSWVIPLNYLDGHEVKLRAEIESTPELAKAIFKK